MVHASMKLKDRGRNVVDPLGGIVTSTGRESYPLTVAEAPGFEAMNLSANWCMILIRILVAKVTLLRTLMPRKLLGSWMLLVRLKKPEYTSLMRLDTAMEFILTLSTVWLAGLCLTGLVT